MAEIWIGVADVAAEMNLTDRAAWELVKRIGVPVVEGPRSNSKNARFLRSEFEAARDRSKGPAPGRSPYGAKESSRPVAASTAAPTAPGAAASKLAKLRGL